MKKVIMWIRSIIFFPLFYIHAIVRLLQKVCLIVTMCSHSFMVRFFYQRILDART